MTNRSRQRVGGVKRHPAGLSQLERALRVAGEKHTLKTDTVGAVRFYDLLDTMVNAAQPLALALRPGRGDGAMGDMRKGTSDGFNHAPPCHHRSRVDANYFHRKG